LDIYNRDRLEAGIFDRLPHGGTDLGVQRPYQIFDFNLVFKPVSLSWTVSAFINNATDKHIKIDSGNVITEAGLVATYMAPRTYGVQFNYQFDQ
jgi:hypothetical protein